MTRTSALALATLLLAGAVSAGPPEPWRDRSKPAADRAHAMVAALTDAEKLSLVHGDVTLNGNGTGTNPCVGHVPAIPRLGLPALCMGDGPAGVSNGMTGVTQFPAPVAGAASWDEPLERAYGEALGAEHAAKGRNVVLAPTINILRTPKWGRAAETLSEDPFLTARLGSAVTAGIQSRGVIATPKHFVANNQEWLRLGDAPAYQAIDVRVGDRALNEIYYPGFRAAVQAGSAGSIMCAYNRVNGHYACENPDTLAALRRWGFDGFVVSDWYFAHRSTVGAAKAGLDISMPGGSSPFGFTDLYGAPLATAIRTGEVSRATLDAMATRIVTPMIRLGLVDHPVTGSATAVARTPAHVALAQQIAEEGTVLLRNEGGLLPLRSAVRTLAVIGDDAGAHVQTSERYGGFVQDPAIVPTPPVDAIRMGARGARVVYARGTLGTGALPAIPAAALRTPGGGPGLVATYYASGDWSGPPILTRTEADLDRAAVTAPGLPKIWSARWEGMLAPTATGRTRFSLAGGGDIRLTIAGREVARTPRQSFRLETHGTADLVAGRPVPIRIDYSNAATILPSELRLGWQPYDPALIEQAVAAARAADVAVVFASDNVSEGADRTDLRLPGDQDALIAAVAAANPRTVVVLHTVGPVLMPWRDQVAGIFAGWYPGERAGEAIAALLFGTANPSGKLPMTFPADETHGPADTPARYPGIGTTVRYDEGLLVGYRWFDAKGVTPLYPFGHGLSYTRFAFSDLKVAPSGDGWEVRATIANVGERAGAEVAQLYLGFPAAAGEPPRQLKGFARVALQPGERRTISLPLARADLSIWDEAAGGWRVPAGRFTVEVGASSRDLPLAGAIEVAR